jgi:hypothetical protein
VGNTNIDFVRRGATGLGGSEHMRQFVLQLVLPPILNWAVYCINKGALTYILHLLRLWSSIHLIWVII